MTKTEIGCKSVSLAALSRSRTRLDQALRRRPSGILERNDFNKTPLHLAVGWPEGVDHLLLAGTDVNAADKCGRPALWYACEIGCLDSVQLLLAEDNSRVLCSEWRPPFVLDVILEAQNPSTKIIDEVIVGLVHRRNRLFNLARENISRSSHDAMTQVDRVLDHRMSEIVQALNDAEVPIPPALMSQPERQNTVYHTRILTADLAEKLYKAGFKDVDEYDVHGWTPLMILPRKGTACNVFLTSTGMTPWLIAKGANICKRSAEQYPWRAWDNVARLVGEIVSEPYRNINLFGFPHKPRLWHKPSYDSLGWI